MPYAHPHPSFHFLVEAGFVRIGFTRVHLPRMEREIIRYRESSDLSEVIQQLPGLLRLSECVLERGVMHTDNDFFMWMSTINVGRVQLRDITVKLLNDQHEPTKVWQLRDTFPTKLEWSVLDAQTSTVLIETLHLSVASMYLPPT